jgi:hypothetical protein
MSSCFNVFSNFVMQRDAQKWFNVSYLLGARDDCDDVGGVGNDIAAFVAQSTVAAARRSIGDLVGGLGADVAVVSVPRDAKGGGDVFQNASRNRSDSNNF